MLEETNKSVAKDYTDTKLVARGELSTQSRYSSLRIRCYRGLPDDDLQDWDKIATDVSLHLNGPPFMDCCIFRIRTIVFGTITVTWIYWTWETTSLEVEFEEWEE